MGLTLVGLNDTINLRDDAVDFLRAQGWVGWGLVPVVNQFFEGAGDGKTFLSSRRSSRKLTLPIMVFGSNPGDMQAKISRLAKITHNKLTLQFVLSDGTVWNLPAVYESGAEGDFYAYGRAEKMPIAFDCPYPYWTAAAVKQFGAAYSPTVRGLLPLLAQQMVSSSGVLGQVSVTNSGDVPTPIVWRITGPCATATIAVNGQGFTFNTALSASETLIVDANGTPYQVTDLKGANRFTGLLRTTPPKFPKLPVGTTNVSISMTGAGSGAQVVGTFQERREVVYG